MCLTSSAAHAPNKLSKRCNFPTLQASLFAQTSFCLLLWQQLVKYLNLLFGSSRRADLFRQVHMKIAMGTQKHIVPVMVANAHAHPTSVQVWQIPALPCTPSAQCRILQVPARSGVNDVA